MSSDTEKKEPRRRPTGPMGIGDPDDKRLRHMEKDVIIPSIKGRYIREEKCVGIIEVYEQCVVKAGLILAPFKCKQLKLEMKDCVDYWHDSDELLARAKKEYLEERSDYRRTGVCKQNREYIQQLMEDRSTGDHQRQ